MSPALKRRERSHVFERDDFDHYVEPSWCTKRLLDVEPFAGPILDPAVGWGRVIQQVLIAGYSAIASDGAERWRDERSELAIHFQQQCCRQLDFLGVQREEVYRWWRQANSIVSNPPFDQFEDFYRRASALMFQDRPDETANKIAFVWLTQRLNAASWLRDTPLRRIWYMTPRPSMPTGEHILKVDRGERDPKTGKPLKVGGGKQDFCWLVWQRGYRGEPGVRWLDRDAEA